MLHGENAFRLGAFVAKHPHKIRSKVRHLTRKPKETVKHPDSAAYFAGSGLFLDLTDTRRPAWPQPNRISWVEQRRLEHRMQEHEGKSEIKQCVQCQDYEIWLALQKPRTSQRLVAAKLFGTLNPKAALSKVYRAKERIEKGIPGVRMKEEYPLAEAIASSPALNEPCAPNSVSCSCGALISARTREIALRALKKHEREVHGRKDRPSKSN